MPAVLSLAWARLRYRPARRLLVALGVAVATVLPVLAHGSAAIAASQALAHGLAALDPGQRSLTVSSSSGRLDPARLTSIDADVRARLGELAAGPVHRELLFRRISDGRGGTYFLGAADNLAGSVRITEGRLPASCTPTRCEVVVLGSGTPTLDPALGLVIVGRATQTDPLLLTGTFAPGKDAPMLLGDGVAAVAGISSFELFQRSYGWVTPVDLERVRALGVDGYLRRSAQVSDALAHRGDALALTAPDEVLRSEAARAERSARRFTLLGGAATALLLGFAAIGAIGLRPDHAAAVELLRRRGTPRRRARLLTAVEASAPVLAGVLIGLLAGGALAGWRSARAGLAGWNGGELAVRTALPEIAVGAVAAALIVALTLAWPPASSSRAAWRTVDAVVIAGLAVAGLALARGSVTVTGLADRTDPLLLALPVVAVVCGGLLVGQVWPAVTGAVGRLVPRRWLGARLGLLGAVRRPLRPVATAAFIAGAVGVVAFAGAYRATLAQGATDQAAFAVPLDARVTVGSDVDRPLSVATGRQYESIAPGVTVHPVLRASAGVRASATASLPVQAIGVDPAALSHIEQWSHVVGGSSPAAAARLIGSGSGSGDGRTTRLGVAVPAGARTLSFTAGGDFSRVVMTAWLRSPDGQDFPVPLTFRSGVLSGLLPAGANGTLFAIVVTEPFAAATYRQHRLNEGHTDDPIPTGTLQLGLPRFDESTADSSIWTGWASTVATVAPASGTLQITYHFTGVPNVVRPGGGESEPIPVLVDRETAGVAVNGVIQLSLEGNVPVAARVVGVLPRFPTTGQRFIVADVYRFADLLDTLEPGTGSPIELWLAAPPDQRQALAAALAQSPYDRLRVDLRQAREDSLAGDPLARGAAGLLTASGIVALFVGLLALVLLVIAERRDEAAELYTWESDGVSPGTLRLSLFARAAAVLGVAVPGGLLVGLILASITTTLVTVTAVGTEPVPPLVLAIGPRWIVLLALSAALIGLACAGLASALALRERMPRRPEEAL